MLNPDHDWFPAEPDNGHVVAELLKPNGEPALLAANKGTDGAIAFLAVLGSSTVGPQILADDCSSEICKLRPNNDEVDDSPSDRFELRPECCDDAEKHRRDGDAVDAEVR